MNNPPLPDRVLDHNDECVGCGAHFSDPCHPACPFETGEFGTAALLRAAATRLREHRAGDGYDIGEALWMAATALVGRDRREPLTDDTYWTLTDFLVNQLQVPAEPIAAQVLHRYGRGDVATIARSMYAAAAHTDGIAFDADDFGDIAP